MILNGDIEIEIESLLELSLHIFNIYLQKGGKKRKIKRILQSIWCIIRIFFPIKEKNALETLKSPPLRKKKHITVAKRDQKEEYDQNTKGICLES